LSKNEDETEDERDPSCEETLSEPLKLSAEIELGPLTKVLHARQ